MKLLSKESIIFYSILGAVTAFILAPFIRSLIDFSTPIEILITTSIIIPIYIIAKRLPTRRGPNIAPALPITLYKPKNSPAFSLGINCPNTYF